jgi:hypothetical protein
MTKTPKKVSEYFSPLTLRFKKPACLTVQDNELHQSAFSRPWFATYPVVFLVRFKLLGEIVPRSHAVIVIILARFENPEKCFLEAVFYLILARIHMRKLKATKEAFTSSLIHNLYIPSLQRSGHGIIDPSCRGRNMSFKRLFLGCKLKVNISRYRLCCVKCFLHDVSLQLLRLLDYKG